jgi:molybdopterin/thiamine biosynthesis adenylyltransferase
MHGKLLERFSRNILLDEIDITGQVKFANSSALVIGGGGLASFVLPLIVSNGVGEITIYDDDKVSSSNLPRQVIFTEKQVGKFKVDCIKKYLQERNSTCEIEVFRQKFTRIDISKYSCIIDLTDSYQSRILSNRLALEFKKPFFTGSTQGFVGQVYSFANHLNGMPCYECLFSEIDESSCQTCENAGVFAPAVEIVGGFIAANVLKYLAGITVDFEEILLLNLLENFKKTKLTKDSNCQCKNYHT